MHRFSALLTLILFLVCLPLHASEEIIITTSSGTEIPVTVFPASGKTKQRLIWLPTEYGIHGREDLTAEQIANNGTEVWIADLHGAYFMPFGRSSYNKVSIDDVKELIVNATKHDQLEPVLFATGRAAPLAMMAVHQLQKTEANRNLVKRAILMHPNFYARTTNVGEKISYLPITESTNLALYILQPELSGKYWQMTDLKHRLEKSGSDVLLRKVPGVADGYNVREPDNAAEEKMYQQTGELITHAIQQLERYKKQRHPATLTRHSNGRKANSLNAGLQPYKGSITQPYLNFSDLTGAMHTMKKHKGNVLLLNFWATWCPPCVKELPSLTRLQRKFENQPFNVLAVNIGESSDTVEEFLKPMDIAFPVLTDPDGASVSKWNLIAFPSSFVIDKKGNILFGLFGGIEWDNPDVVAKIENLLRQN